MNSNVIKIKLEQVKDHFIDYWKVYGAGVGCAGITYIIMRNVDLQHIGPGISGTASRGISVTGQNVVMSNVSLISSNRSGPPSWVVRCLETGDIFTSQHSTSVKMNLPEAEVSKHLNGLMDDVRGYHFERICMAA